MNLHIRKLQEQSTRIYLVNMHADITIDLLVMQSSTDVDMLSHQNSETSKSHCISELNRSNRSNNNASVIVRQNRVEEARV